MRFLTAGESHGRGLVAILEGFPKGVCISDNKLQHALSKRKKGFGRGKRMQIEHDRAEIISGLRNKISLGSPIGILIYNRDNRIFPFGKDKEKPVEIPRPAHADLAGMLKYNTKDARDILERASARETAARVAVGNICAQALEELGVKLISYVTQIGEVRAYQIPQSEKALRRAVDASVISCPDKIKEKEMIQAIKNAKENQDTLGGTFEVRIVNVPAGLGSCMHWERRLDARLSYHLMSVPAVKAVEIGAGVEYAHARGSSRHDEIFYAKSKKKFYRKTNNAGGIEGGISNGEEIVVRGHMKPIATLMKPLQSVHVASKTPSSAHIERSDVTAVSSCSVVAENICAFVILDAFLEKFGSDSFLSIQKNYTAYLKDLKIF